MNWKRGFFRCWIGVSALWIVAAGALFAFLYAEFGYAWNNNTFFALIGMVLLPPGALFLVGLALIWVATGFTNRER